MQCTRDEAMNGWAMIFDGPLDLAKEAALAQSKIPTSEYCSIDPSTGSGTRSSRKFKTWADTIAAYSTPWEEGVRRVEMMLEELREQDIPAPLCRLRKKRWSDNDGEVDADRVMRGVPEFYQETRRQTTKGPTSVAVFCNSDSYAADTPEKVFWRGAAAIAVVDLLEANGYSCEVHLWCRGRNVYDSLPNQFTTCPIKQADAPLDIDAMVNALSDWFLRLCIFGSFATARDHGARQRGIGSPVYQLEGWAKYVQVSDNMAQVHVPAVKSKEKAILVARNILSNINSLTS